MGAISINTDIEHHFLVFSWQPNRALRDVRLVNVFFSGHSLRSHFVTFALRFGFVLAITLCVVSVTLSGFFGVFTVPKVCSSYSSQITAYGNFWIRRFEDAWESCTHKKAVAIAIFTLVWNLSSVVARVWAVFMVYVGIRYYQQSVMVRDDWGEEEEYDGDAVAEDGEESSTCSQNGGSRGGHGDGVGPTIVELSKNRKGS